jgi:hypothetical protein
MEPKANIESEARSFPTLSEIKPKAQIEVSGGNIPV